MAAADKLTIWEALALAVSSRKVDDLPTRLSEPSEVLRGVRHVWATFPCGL